MNLFSALERECQFTIRRVAGFVVAVTTLLLTACVDPVEVSYFRLTHPEVLYIGDSNCTGDNTNLLIMTAPQQAGVRSDCEKGRQMVGYTNDLPGSEQGITVIFLALGLNDADPARLISADRYGNSLLAKLDSTDATVYCVKPFLAAWYVELHGDHVRPYREKMEALCSHTIHPADYGVVVEYLDGIHWYVEDHNKFVTALKSRI